MSKRIPDLWRQEFEASDLSAFRQGNWPHPDGIGRIVGWIIPNEAVERMGADAYCLPREIDEALTQLAALRAQPEAAAQPAQPVAESWWLMESTVTPRPLFYAGHNKHSDGALKPTVTENAAQAVRFPDEWTAKYTLAHLLGIDVSGPRWTFAFMNSGYAVREHIFDYTPRALASPPPAPKTGDGSAIEGGDSTHGGEQ